MTPSAAEALRVAADDLERLASHCEVEADLLRQCAGLARAGRIADYCRMRDRLTGMRRPTSTELADRLVMSVIDRDPDLWRVAETDLTTDLVRQMPLKVLESFAALHQATCDHGRTCPVMEIVAARIKDGR